MIIRTLNFKDGTNGSLLKNGVTGAMLTGEGLDLRGGYSYKKKINIAEVKAKILKHLEDGLKQSKIAKAMFISPQTVSHHWRNMAREKGTEWEEQIKKKQLKNKGK